MNIFAKIVFDGTGEAGTVLASENIASFSKIETGVFEITTSIDMGGLFYGILGNSRHEDGFAFIIPEITSSTSFIVSIKNVDGNLIDATYNFIYAIC